MPSITLNNVPKDLYLLIKTSTSLNLRSINSEILFHLNKTFGYKPVDQAQLRKRIEKLQKRVS